MPFLAQAPRPAARVRFSGLLGASLVLCGTSAPARPDAAWPDTVTARLEALALIETLNADLLSHDSATLTLDRWCESHRLGAPARIVAERLRDRDKPAGTAERQALKIGLEERVAYRRVRLRCGARVLSEADNWYVPARLTPEMNRVLDTTDTPFGRAVQALNFSRHTVSAERLWRPLPEGWEMGAPLPAPDPAGLAVPAQLLRHRAVLSVPDGTPFSLVVETYTGDVLGFVPATP